MTADRFADWHRHLDPELHHAHRESLLNGHAFDVADAREAADRAMCRWLHLPMPVALTAALSSPDPLCTCTSGNCGHEQQP